MSHHNDEKSIPSLVPSGQTSELLTRENAGNFNPAGGSNASPHHAPEVVSGSFDKNGFFHALRRRWLAIMLLGLVTATFASLAVWVLVPETSVAEALIQVRAKQPIIAFSNINQQAQGFEVLLKTQSNLIKTRFILDAALRDNSISSLSMFKEHSQNPSDWLSRQLQIGTGKDSEIISVKMGGAYPGNDLKKVVDSVISAYQTHVIGKEKRNSSRIVSTLRNSLTKLTLEIREVTKTIRTIAKETGLTQPGEIDNDSRLLINDIIVTKQMIRQAQKSIQEAQITFLTEQKKLKDPLWAEAQISELASGDKQLAILKEQLMMLDMQIRSVGAAARNGSSRQLNNLLSSKKALAEEITQHRQQLKKVLLAENKSFLVLPLRNITSNYEIQAGALSKNLQTLSQQVVDMKKLLDSKNVKNIELALAQAELKHLNTLQADMSIQMQKLNIESLAPPRIYVLHNAIPTERINTTSRIAITALGGLAAFGMVCFGISYLEFTSRRLNGPRQMDEGLGVRVIGTLPSLSARAAADPSHPLVAQLSDSIDGVRTALMHDSTSQPRRVVLVTSPAAHEGRTTVASQLAASLARAGRRTLLIDGDLRRPALHNLFGLGLEPGLSEVLRAESDVMDVVRQTASEGLWVLTSGACDTTALHALATDQLQPIFEKIRDEFDFVIIDGAPVMGLSDSLLFGQYCDGAILSVLRDHSQLPKIYRTLEIMKNVGIRVIGTVVNGVHVKADQRVTQPMLIPTRAVAPQLEEV